MPLLSMYNLIFVFNRSLSTQELTAKECAWSMSVNNLSLKTDDLPGSLDWNTYN